MRWLLRPRRACPRMPASGGGSSCHSVKPVNMRRPSAPNGVSTWKLSDARYCQSHFFSNPLPQSRHLGVLIADRIRKFVAGRLRWNDENFRLIKVPRWGLLLMRPSKLDCGSTSSPRTGLGLIEVPLTSGRFQSVWVARE